MRFLFLVLVIFVVSGCNPSKVTDPSSPEFDPKKFRFSDYSTNTDFRNNIYQSELSLVMKKILKTGMTEEEVDQIILNDPYVKKIDINHVSGKNFKNYFYKRWYMHLFPSPNRVGISIYVEYSQDGKLLNYFKS